MTAHAVIVFVTVYGWVARLGERAAAAAAADPGV
jgi:hypothetical protein